MSLKLTESVSSDPLYIIAADEPEHPFGEAISLYVVNTSTSEPRRVGMYYPESTRVSNLQSCMEDVVGIINHAIYKERGPIVYDLPEKIKRDSLKSLSIEGAVSYRALNAREIAKINEVRGISKLRLVA